MRRFAYLGTVVATTIAMLPALASSLPASSGQFAVPGTASMVGPVEPAPQDASGEGLTVTNMAPRVVRPDSTITVSGTVTNTSGAPLEGVRVRLRYGSSPFPNRTELDAYAAGERAEPQNYGPEDVFEAPIAPGDSEDYTLRVSAERLTLNGSGVYPIIVEVVDESWSTIGTLRSFLPYTQPGDDLDATRIAWVWPLMDHPHRADDDTFLGQTLEEQLGPEGRLDRLLRVGAEYDTGPAEDDGSAGIPLTWAVDPALLDDVDRLTEDHHVLQNPTAVPARSQTEIESNEASEHAGPWLDEARTALADSPLIATPYANPDLVALLDSGLERDAEAAVTLGRESVERHLQREADIELAWPAAGLLDSGSHEFLAEHGAQTFLLSDSVLPAEAWAGYTPTAESALPGQAGGTGLAADSQLSRILAADSHSPGDATLAEQRFVAETLMITVEQPNSSGTVVAAPPPDWDPGGSFARGVLEASETLPWLEPVPLSGLSAEPDTETGRQSLRYTDDADSVLSTTYLDQLKEVRREARLFNSVLAGEDDPFRPAILRLESGSWNTEEALAGQAREQVSAAVEEAQGQVRILRGEPVTMASKSGQAPILVANDLEDHSVTVHLSVFSQNSERLSVRDYTETMEIAPGGRTTVFIPLTATVNGRTDIHVRLHNADGEPISSETTTVPVTVTGLGSSALLISGVAALVLVLLIVPRVLRRWRRSRHGNRESAQAEEPAGERDGDTINESTAGMRQNGEGHQDRPESEGDPARHSAATSDSGDPGPAGSTDSTGTASDAVEREDPPQHP